MADQKINILGMGSAQSGVTYHRVALPMGFMDNVGGLITNSIETDLVADKYDIFYYNRVNPYHELHNQIREKFGCKIVMDIDDDWDLPRTHLMYETYIHLNPKIIKNLQDADMVTCTHEKLAEKCRRYNSNVHIMPNALPYREDQFTNDRYMDEDIRIFWAGGITHGDDLKQLTYPIRRLKGQKGIKMVIGGYDPANETSIALWNEMINAFTANRTLNHEVLNAKPVLEYMELYRHADIMLVPLKPTEWASYKSNLKLLEAAVKGIPVICQAVEPYIFDKDAPVLWVHKAEDWYKHMNFLIHNKNAREDYGQKIHQWGIENYNLRAINKTRRAAFANLVGA